MKKFFGMLIMLVFFLLPQTSFQAMAKELDYIREYMIDIEVREDGSLDMYYHITWEVLDSKSEGPLEWVKIGIPNAHVTDIRALSDTIDKIRYLSDGGDYVRIDLDKKYYAGEVVEFEFYIHQYNMHQKKPQQGICTYSFTPGWFDESRVGVLTIFWNQDKVQNLSDGYGTVEDCYYWRTSLDYGERFTVEIEYADDAFQYTDGSHIGPEQSYKVTLFLFCIIIPLFFFLIVLLCRKRVGKKDHYTKNRGMGSAYVAARNSSTRRSGGGGGCACACACACAGGGRAGCSKKDFYGTKLETRRIKEALLR